MNDSLKFIKDYFNGRIGFLIDIGSAQASMSAPLFDLGWSGLLLEPLPSAWLKLDKRYKDNPRVDVLQVACSNKAGHLPFYPADLTSTLNKDWADACESHWDHIKYGPEIRVQCHRLSWITKIRNIKTIDYLKIDTESNDYQVLLSHDWRIKPELICIETLDMLNPVRNESGGYNPSDEIDGLLTGAGYRLEVTTKDGNGIYLRRD